MSTMVCPCSYYLILREFTTRSYSIENNGLGCAFPFPAGLYQLTCTSFRIFLPKLSNLHPMLILPSRRLQTVQSGEFFFSSYFSYPLTPPLTNPASLNLRYLGGLLSAYELIDRQYSALLQKAKQLADKMAFAWVGVRISFDSLQVKRLTPMPRRRMPFRLDISTSSQRRGRFVIKYIVVCCSTSWHPLH